MENGNRKSIANSQVFLNTNGNPLLSYQRGREDFCGRKENRLFLRDIRTLLNEMSFFVREGRDLPSWSISRHIAENIEDIFIFGIKFPENPGIDIVAF
jgi:hypothetical protein